MEEVTPTKPESSKNGLVIIIILFLIVLVGIGSFLLWFFMFKKSAEGGDCNSTSDCKNDLNCVNEICSSGSKGSPCNTKADCNTDFCINEVCTDGIVGDSCVTYKDCQKGLLCTEEVCSNVPDYSKYFSEIKISKMKIGSPPGPDNIPVETTTFTDGDALEIDFIGVVPTAKGKIYMEIIDSTTGELVFTTENNMDLALTGEDSGFGVSYDADPGQYDLIIYFKGEAIYTTTITRL